MKNKSCGIGGQAVLEGIMMKNKDKYAVAVRKPDKEIELKVEEYKGVGNKSKIFRIPFIRGVFNFIDSMVLGIKTLTYSADFYEEEEEKEKVADKVTKKVFKEKAEAFLMGLTVFASVCFSIALFIVLPHFISAWIEGHYNIREKALISIIEGFLRIAIFLMYIFLVSMMEDIKRTFMYHGAEHKCINCIEKGLELSVDNVRKSSRFHKRCGTSFLFLVMFISIVCFIIVSAVLPEDLKLWQTTGVRLLLVPVIAGISYEVLKLAGNHDNILIKIISAPGMWIQRMTTKEPDDSMIEVAIVAVEAVFDWKTYQAFDKSESAIMVDLKEEEAKGEA